MSGESLKSTLYDCMGMPDEAEDEEMEESDDSGSGSAMHSNASMLREQDRFLPICNIIKIMKVTVPDNGKIAKDARECIQECVSEFISFVTSEAIDRSHTENRKTVNGDDLLYAFLALGFDNYVAPLSIYLNKYREATKSDRNIIYPQFEEIKDTDEIMVTQNGINTSNMVENNHAGGSNTIVYSNFV